MPASSSCRGERLDHLPPYNRRVNTVFQHYALFPHLERPGKCRLRPERGQTCRARRLPHRVEQALAMVKMSAFASQSRRRSAEDSSSALRWPARSGEPSKAASARRTAFGARRQPAPPDAGRIEIAAARGRDFICLRHPRSGRSHGDVRPHCVVALRRARADRLSPRNLQPPGHVLHRAVYRTHQPAARRCQDRHRLLRIRSAWPVKMPDGPALFSLRPENIRIAGRRRTRTPCDFADKIRHQTFHGATELLQIECADGLQSPCVLRADWQRTGRSNLEFLPLTPFRCAESGANRTDVLASLSSRRHCPSAAVGRGLSTAPLRPAFCYSFWSVSPSQAIVHPGRSITTANCSAKTSTTKPYFAPCGSPPG